MHVTHARHLQSIPLLGTPSPRLISYAAPLCLPSSLSFLLFPRHPPAPGHPSPPPALQSGRDEPWPASTTPSAPSSSAPSSPPCLFSRNISYRTLLNPKSPSLSGAVATQALLYLKWYGGHDIRRNNLVVSLLGRPRTSGSDCMRATKVCILWCVLSAISPDFSRSTLFRFLDALHLSMAFASTWFYLIRNWGSDSIHDYIPW